MAVPQVARHFEPENRLGTLNVPRILVVENDAEYAVALMNYLKAWRMPMTGGTCKVDIAKDIESARPHLDGDSIDIFILDLIIAENADSSEEHDSIGKNFVREVVEKSNAGIIVHSSLAARTEAAPMLHEGADDYVEKASDREIFRARLLALWRRIQFVRPKTSNAFAHANRVFAIGNWRFVVGDRILKHESGETARLSPTEHAFLRHICTVEEHLVDKESFNICVLGRRPFEGNKRIDNFIYRIRNKLGLGTHLISLHEGTYKLIDVREIRPKMK
jgi:DNA-binding response OmpR family regulator